MRHNSDEFSVEDRKDEFFDIDSWVDSVNVEVEDDDA